MKKLALLILASFLLSGSGYAQISTFPWTEGFESGDIPIDWMQVYVSGSDDWLVFEIEYPHSGTYSALFLGWLSNGGATKLITPQLDLTGLTNPVLKFWHLEPSEEYEGPDTLKLYYRNSSTGTWNLLATYASGILDWTEEVIALPNASNDYYIAFEGGFCLPNRTGCG